MSSMTPKLSPQEVKVNLQPPPLPRRVRPAQKCQAAVCFSSALPHVNLSGAREAEFLPPPCTPCTLCIS